MIYRRSLLQVSSKNLTQSILSTPPKTNHSPAPSLLFPKLMSRTSPEPFTSPGMPYPPWLSRTLFAFRRSRKPMSLGKPILPLTSTTFFNQAAQAPGGVFRFLQGFLSKMSKNCPTIVYKSAGISSLPFIYTITTFQLPASQQPIAS